MIPIDPSTTVAEFLHIILGKLGVNDASYYVPYFGLYESLDGRSLGTAKNMDDLVSMIVSQWGPTSAKARFVFMIRLHMASVLGLRYPEAANGVSTMQNISDVASQKDMGVKDQVVLHLQYIQCHYNIITGNYPTSEDEALQLGIYHFGYKFGEYNPLSHKPGFLGMRIVEFIPIHHVKQSSIQEWENRLFATMSEQADDGGIDTFGGFSGGPDGHGEEAETIDRRILYQKNYCGKIYQMQAYGCTFFMCKYASTFTLPPSMHDFPPDPVIAIYNNGVHILKPSLSYQVTRTREVYRSYKLEEIYRWGYKDDGMFYFDVKANGEETGTIGLETKVCTYAICCIL